MIGEIWSISKIDHGMHHDGTRTCKCQKLTLPDGTPGVLLEVAVPANEARDACTGVRYKLTEVGADG